MSDGRIAPAGDRLAGLVFELAAQLHVERAQRLALSAVLEKTGLLDTAALAAVAADPEFRRRSQAALEESLDRLMRVLAEGDDPKRPLADRSGGRSAGDRS